MKHEDCVAVDDIARLFLEALDSVAAEEKRPTMVETIRRDGEVNR
jgi:hypothetical protein